MCLQFPLLQLAQLRHALGQKEGLLRLYAQDANETNNEGEGEGEEKKGDWIRALTEECRDLRESNLKLTAEVSSFEKCVLNMLPFCLCKHCCYSQCCVSSLNTMVLHFSKQADRLQRANAVLVAMVLHFSKQADRLQRATAEIEKKERHLVTQCLEQFAEAKGKLSELRDREEHISTENRGLQVWSSHYLE